jgi:paraquat-inducible protein B
MSDMEKTNPVVPEAKVVTKKRGRFSFVWIIPIVAALVGAWIGINTIRNQGPTITIIFKSAEGLEANKTMIRYNGVEVGEIVSIRLSDDHQSVIASAKMHAKTEEFLHQDTQFWVVKPEISGANISGLSTILSGAYIGMEIGKAKESERHFKALEDAPLETGGVRGRFFTLKTPVLGSLNKGTPIYFRRLQAGQVASYELDQSGTFLNVRIFVQEPYDKFVTSDTRFWHASGMDLSLSASGLQVRTESVLSILIGGIAFETPEASTQLPPAADNAAFALSDNRAAAFRPPPVSPRKFKIVFTEPLRGLAVGAPVELNGITIGEVTDIHAQFDAQTHDFSAPVTIMIDPARYGVDFLNDPVGAAAPDEAEHRKTMDLFVARGLRAQLKTGSLITGSQFVALEFFPDAKPVTLDWSQTPLQLPTEPGMMNVLESRISDIVAKVDQIPFKDIGDNLNHTLVGAQGTLIGVQGTLTNASVLLRNAGQMVGPNSLLDTQLNATLQQVGGAAQALRILADYLERHPEALLLGKPNDPK